MDGFAWLTEDEFRGLDISNVSEDSDIGYILEVDLKYPTELHDLYSDFPLSPVKLSLYCQQLKEDLGLKEPSTGKLIPNLDIILPYKNLKLYLDLGMKLMKVNRV